MSVSQFAQEDLRFPCSLVLRSPTLSFGSAPRLLLEAFEISGIGYALCQFNIRDWHGRVLVSCSLYHSAFTFHIDRSS